MSKAILFISFLCFMSLSFADDRDQFIGRQAGEQNLMLCDWSFKAQEVAKDYERVFYRWKDLHAYYEGLNIEVNNRKISAQQCWNLVEKKLKKTGVPGGFRFSARGVSTEFVKWYDKWYEDTFLSNYPGGMRSQFFQELDYLADLSWQDDNA